MDQYSPTYFSIISSNQLHPKSDKVNNVSPGHKDIDYHGHSPTDLDSVTKTIKKRPKLKRDYMMISNRLRHELIEAVYTHGEQIKIAAHRLGINYSSAKAICQVYKREGRSAKKTTRVSHAREEKVVYAIEDAVEDTSVFLTCSHNSPEDSVKAKEDQDFSDNVSTQEPLLVVKDSAMRTFPSIQETAKRITGTEAEIEEVGDITGRKMIPGGQPRTSDHKRKLQNSKPKTVKTTILQQPVICSEKEQSKIYPSLMSLLPSHTTLPGLNPNPQMQIYNIQSINIPNHSSPIDPIQLMNSNYLQMLKLKAQAPIYENINYILPQRTSHSNIIYPQPQQQLAYVYVYAVPQQNTNIVSTQIGGVPVLLNPAYHMPTQSLNPQFMAYSLVHGASHN